MITYVPYTDLAPETLESTLDITAGAVRYVDVSGSDTNYWEMCNENWIRGETWGLVEHDIILPIPDRRAGGHMEEMYSCVRQVPPLWCASAYPYFDNTYAGFGCVVFHEDLMRRFPTLMYEAGEFELYLEHPFRHWCALDLAFSTLVERQGIRQCLHADVGHVSGRNELSHGCWILEPKAGRERAW